MPSLILQPYVNVVFGGVPLMFERSHFMDVEKKESVDRIHRKSCRYKIVTAAETPRVCTVIMILFYCSIQVLFITKLSET